MSVASDSWRRIRRLRVSPPLLADRGVDEARTRVFQAALTQAEELWEAASTVGAASRPLPLFYCLSQAGRAICAAWTTEGAWEPKGHGLTSSDQDPEAVASFSVRLPRQNAAQGMFSMVASATDSTVFEGHTSVAALWASLVDMPRAKSLVGDEPTPIYIERTRLRDAEYSPFDVIAPKVARFTFPRPTALTPDPAQPDDNERFIERVRGVLDDYPSIAAATVEVADVTGRFGVERVPTLRVPNADGDFQTLSAFADEFPTSDAEPFARYAVRPRLGTGNERPPSQLMTLWVLVYALSQLARYHPALWVEALDPDRSEIAIDLEHGLDAALDLVPDLLGPALTSGAMPRLIREHQAAEREQARLQDEADAAARRDREGNQVEAADDN